MHSQWEALLILIAAQSNYSLQHCVTTPRLRTLFANSIRFFEAIVQPPPQVKDEREVLLKLYQGISAVPNP